MTALLIILAVLVLLGMIPVGADARYADGQLVLKLRAAFLKKLLIPREKSVKKAKKPKKKTKKKPAPEAEAPKKKKRKLDLETVLALAKIALRTLGRFRRRLSLDLLRLHYTAGGTDPYSVAMQYGYLSAGLAAALPHLDRALNIRERDLALDVDFQLEKPLIDAHVILTIQIWEAVYVVFAAGFAFLGFLIKQKRKNRQKERMNCNGKHSDQQPDAGGHEQDQGNGGREHGGRRAYHHA